MTDFTDPLAAFRLDGRVAIVTGASSGLGARMVGVLHAAGASVVAAARRADRLDAVVGPLERATAAACDVADEEGLERLVRTTLERHARIHLLVNNAGVADPQPAEDEPAAAVRSTIDVNLVGALRLCQLVGRHMLDAGGGTIVNIASVLGLVGVGQIPQVGYVASKHGLIGATRELAAQWARRGIRVNAIAPGWFPTEMTAEMFADDGAVRWMRRKTPMGRAGDLHELDGALLYLASDASSFVTGQVLTVDGGFTAV